MKNHLPTWLFLLVAFLFYFLGMALQRLTPTSPAISSSWKTVSGERLRYMLP